MGRRRTIASGRAPPLRSHPTRRAARELVLGAWLLAAGLHGGSVAAQTDPPGSADPSDKERSSVERQQESSDLQEAAPDEPSRESEVDADAVVDKRVSGNGLPAGAGSAERQSDAGLAQAAATLPTGGATVTGKAISVPKGAGTIKGMEESFSAQLSTGVASFSVPFALPSARGDAQPSLGLSYSSSGGFDVAGVGWSLGVPFVSRQTDRGTPSYDDRADWHPEQDRFVFNGGQELVPICRVEPGLQCSGALPGERMPVWSAGWQYFRARVEGSFLRFYWSPDHLTWRVQDKSGVTMELGVPLDDSSDRTALETNPDDPRQIFRWPLVRQYDTYGEANPPSGVPAPHNVVVYRYFNDGGTSYLSDIFDTPPAAEPATHDLSRFAHHTRIVYDDRTDPTVSYRSGWPIEQRLRTTRVDVTSKTFFGSDSSRRELVRRYHLSYDELYHPSLLTSVQVEGRCDPPVLEDGASALPDITGCPRLPPMTFGYSHVAPFTTDGTGSVATLSGYEGFDERVQSISESPVNSLDEELTILYDINADALPDVLVTEPGLFGGRHGVFFNGSRGEPDRFRADTIALDGVLGASANSITLQNLNVVPLDLDGDATSDLLHMPQVRTYSIYSPIERSTGWVWQGRVIENASSLNPKIDFGSDTLDVKVLDVNFDGLVDLVRTTGTEVQTFFSLGRYPGGDGQFGDASRTGPLSADLSTDPVTSCVPWSGLPVRFSDPEIHLADMNGDGITDIVRLYRGDIRYWPGRGNGFWGTGRRDDCPGGTFGQRRDIAMTDSPYFSDIEGTSLRLDDVNGDGLSDLVQVRFQNVDIWLNVDGRGWTRRHVINDTPTSPSYAARVELTDVDGSGTPDVLWGDGRRYRYMDLMGGARPWLLNRVDNGLGKTTDIEYSTSTAEMLAAERAGAPWTTKMPTVVHVVTRVTESDNLTIAGRPPQQDVTEYTYRDPIYEGRQREFRGFSSARARRAGDENSPADTTETRFLLGECVDEDLSDGIDPCSVENRWRDNPREALKGLPVVTERFDDQGVYVSTQRMTYRLRRLYVGRDGREVRHAFESETTTRLYDTGPFRPGPAGLALVEPAVELELELRASPQTEGCASNAPTPAPDNVALDTSVSVPVRSAENSAVTRTRHVVDFFGNPLAELSDGCIAGSACPPGGDEIITTHTVPALPPGDPTGWLFRTVEQCVTGDRHAVVRNRTITEYNARGDPEVTRVALSGTLPLLREVDDSGVAHPPRSADGLLLVVDPEYDPAFGNLVREVAPNNRCRDIQYDPTYEQLTADEVIYTGGCGINPLTTRAEYDRGYELVTTVIDIQGQPTTVVYDALGRLSQLFKPHPTLAGAPSALPSVRVEYFLPPELGLRHSVIHTETQDSADHDQEGYLESWTYVDGFGKSFATLNEAEPASGAGTGSRARWIVAGLSDYDDKSAVRRKYLEFFFEGDPQRFAFETRPASPYGRQRYDAFSRQLQTFDLDGTVTLQSKYHALSTDLSDAADLTAGPHQGTFATETRDGHGRTVSTVERFHEGVTMQTRETRTEYLPTNEPEVIRRIRGTAGPDREVVRWMRYDSIGRMVLNVEPNTSPDFTADASADPTNLRAWRYAYDDFGEIVGTSDARGCGANYFYDGAGRLLVEDYFPCESHQPGYSPVDFTTAGEPQGIEVLYEYDALPGDLTSDALPPGMSFTPDFLQGRLVRIRSRGSHLLYSYDGRGRLVEEAVQVKRPGAPDDALAERYAPRWYPRQTTYDALDRPSTATTGARLSELAGNDGGGLLRYQYDSRGLLARVDGSYNLLIHTISREADNLVSEVVYGDVARTRTASTYDDRRRLRTVQTFRSGSFFPEGFEAADPTTFQLLLQDEEFSYDVVNNPVEIRDYRIAEEWPAGAKPVTKRIAYDDLYRASEVTYEYAAGDDLWVSPFAHENAAGPPPGPGPPGQGGGGGGRPPGVGPPSAGGGSGSNPIDPLEPRVARPSPHVSFEKRLLWQRFEYDWLGNTAQTDDDVRGFYDRSLGAIENGTPTAGPYQLRRASNAGLSTRDGALRTEYDDAGNLLRMFVDRNGSCLPTAARGCGQRFEYEWDEVGRLTRARRWDESTLDVEAPGATPGRVPDAQLSYEYDADDQRVAKSAMDGAGRERHTLYVFETLEVRRAAFIREMGGTEDYELTTGTEVPYLFANGVRLGRVVFQKDADVTTVGEGTTNVFFELGDHLGSTSVVIDQGTSELVERGTYQAYGAGETDYRPDKWKGFREDYRFTGKEEDVEVGLQYFGKRYYAPLLGRWVSADPLEVHDIEASDRNLYSYVKSQPLRNIDPRGLQDVPAQRSRASRRQVLVVAGPQTTRLAGENDRFQRNARRFIAAARRQSPADRTRARPSITGIQVESFRPGEQRRFSPDGGRTPARVRDQITGSEASLENQGRVYSAIAQAARQAGRGGTVVLVGHGGVGTMSTIFQMGSGDTAFIMDKVEVSQGKFDNFLGMVGATLRYHGTQGIRFAGCLIGQDKEYAQLLANKLGVRADFDEDFLGFGDRGTYSAYRRAHGTSARGFHPREETVRRTGELVGPQRQAYPQQAGDPQL